METKITNETLYDFINCKFKTFLKITGKSGNKTDYELVMTQMSNEFKSRALEALLNAFKKSQVRTDLTEAWLEASPVPQLVINTVVDHGAISFYFDALVLLSESNPGGRRELMPVLFHQPDTVREEQKLILSVGGLILENRVNQKPTRGLIVFGKGLTTTIQLERYRTRAELLIKEIIQLYSGVIQPRCLLNKHCHICEFEETCRAEAMEKDDLCLLKRMGEKEIEKLNKKGIFTINQLSFTFRLRKRGKRVKRTDWPHSFPLQALAIREKKVYVFERPSMPSGETRIYIDMEGDESGSFIYLIGILIESEGKETFYSFWANSPTEQDKIIGDFLKILEGFDDFHIFFYGSYEDRVLRRYFKTAADHTGLQRLMDRSSNVLSLVYATIYFPTYSNSLKDIGTFLGCQWSHSRASGIQALLWRISWERTSNDELKHKLIEYNMEDCRALQAVTRFLYAIPEKSPQAFTPSETPVAEWVEESSEDLWQHSWGKKESPIPDFDWISRCAYFDYQREKIYVRNDPSFKRVLARKRKKANARNAHRVNKTVKMRAYRCPDCKSSVLLRDPDFFRSKRCLDLRFFRGGVKRWVTKFVTPRHYCLNCFKYFIPPTYKAKELFGHGLVSWLVNEYVANRVTFENLERLAQNLFDLPVNFGQLHGLKSLAADYYTETRDKILQKIIDGNLIHADETKVHLQKESGYVWVVTNLEEVVYLYRPDRKADFLHDLLRDFKGVLVSDFYTGYDSVDCLQQKCLVHLIRDFNEDLTKHPYDKGFKAIAERFGKLLRMIIATVDRFGLKKRHLVKHYKDIERFYREIEQTKQSASSIVEKYTKRLTKYRIKLFEFLNHDGIPWNNNNAESAIKPFAKYRRLVSGRITESGLADYLVLLSVYQTCKYKEIGFLDFLLSRKRDIKEFTITKGSTRCRSPKKKERVKEAETRKEKMYDFLNRNGVTKAVIHNLAKRRSVDTTNSQIETYPKEVRRVILIAIAMEKGIISPSQASYLSQLSQARTRNVKKSR